MRLWGVPVRLWGVRLRFWVGQVKLWGGHMRLSGRLNNMPLSGLLEVLQLPQPTSIPCQQWEEEEGKGHLRW